MNPLLLAALVGVGAYLLGRADGAARVQYGLAPSFDPEPAALPEARSVDYSREWQNVLGEFEVDYYPPEVGNYIERLLPPPDYDGFSVAPHCKAIAVGEGWWDHADLAMVSMMLEGLNPGQAAKEVMRTRLPSCFNSRAPAAELLLKELYDRAMTMAEGGS